MLALRYSSAALVVRRYQSSSTNAFATRTALRQSEIGKGPFDVNQLKPEALSDRAQAKLQALLNTAINTSSSSSSSSNTADDRDYKYYSQAIKYIGANARKVEGSAGLCHNILEHWIQNSTSTSNSTNGSTPTKNSLDHLLLRRALTEKAGYIPTSIIHPSNNNLSDPSNNLTNSANDLPDYSDFMEVLHAWTDSKVRRKGIYASYLISSWTQSQVHTKPDCKSYCLLIKAWSNSTHRHKKQAIEEIANQLQQAQLMSPLIYCQLIKSLDNLQSKKQRKLSREWLGGLFKSVNDESDVDVTSALIHLIRLNVKNKQVKEAHQILTKLKDVSRDPTRGYELVMSAYKDAGEADKVIELLLEYHELHNIPPTDSMFSSALQAISNQDYIKSKNKDHVLEVTKTLVRNYETFMFDSIDSGKIISISNAPYNALLYLYSRILNGSDLLEQVVSTLSKLSRLASSKSGCEAIAPSRSTYSAALYALSTLTEDKKFAEDSDKIKRVSQLSERYWNRLKECNEQDMYHEYFVNKMKCIASLHENDSIGCDKTIVQDLDQAIDEVLNRDDSVTKDEEDCDSDISPKEEKLLQIFDEARAAGLLSAAILQILRKNTKSTTFENAVGKGRLPKQWFLNVPKMSRAIFTDGSKNESSSRIKLPTTNKTDKNIKNIKNMKAKSNNRSIPKLRGTKR